MPRPVLRTLWDCLGEPEYYLYEQVIGLYTLDLYWPGHGIFAELVWPSESGQPVIDWDAQVSTVTLLRPGSIEQMIHDYYRPDMFGISEAGESFEVGLLREWPGSLDQLTPIVCYQAPYPCNPPE